jgi:prepilin-type N-terminal cleavage/methylation domain-containing protein
MIILKPLRDKGFTIIELMIATAVLSTILLLVTVMMVNIGRLYYKGINQARIQSNVRNVIDEVSQHLKLGDGWQPATGNNNQRAYCIGNTRYTYVIGVQIGQPAPGSSAPTYQHVLWRDDNPTPGSCSITGDHEVNLTSLSPSTDLHGSELIAPRSRLINFSIDGTSPYDLALGVAYGDNDLLCSPSVIGSCNTDVAMPALVDYTHGDLLCKGKQGDQFCATAKLNTSVVRRLP